MAPPSLPIEEQDNLVAALKHGRGEAFDQLYAALHGRIFNLAARVVGDTDAAADITQEVFIKAYTRIPAHQGDLRLEPWLYRVAVNTCYDHLRRRTVRSAAPLDEIDEIADGRDEFERSQTSSAVSSALEKINPRYRTALVLKDLHGFGNAEVAETLGVSQGAANVLLFRARSAFKRAFREAAPAGSGGLSAIGLAAYLPNLPVPEWLHAAPDFASLAPVAASLAPAAAPLAATIPAAQIAGGVAPAAGALAKIGGAIGAKVALGVLGVTALAGGTVAVQQAQTRDPALAPASATPLVTTAPVAGSSAAAGSATTADSERRRYAQGRRSAGHDGRAQAGAGANGGGQNGQSAGQAGAGGGQTNGGSGGASGGGTQAGNGPGAPSGQGSGSGSGSGAGTSAAGAGKGTAGGPAPTASGAGVGTQPAGDGEGAQRPGSGSQPAGNGAP